ncbi:DUF4097 family beta strand repeat-containing protein [Cryptosporangium aurantiacum]|uniref:Putative adhesin n=1 Tax=Cryptosporangium aurantiacum TaxID=134849 RepID=A0A1M7RNF9_9ACTN|nr:DUF4097 family beta strand repeat-containing protein [Cryptosporangium aurantiacum]SHN47865.1 Putative adhesin [Cryptosporangium aurantiacum]
MGAGRIVAVAALAAAAALVGGCDWVLTEKDTQQYEVSGDVHTLSVSGTAVDLDVVTGNGPVVVDEVIRYNGSSPATSHRVTDGTLRLESAGCTEGEACRVRYRVTVPADTRLVVAVDAGTVETSGLTGDLDLELEAGQVTARRAASSRADVRVDVGDVDLRYAQAPDRVAVTTGTGAVSVKLPTTGDYAVRTHTDVGDTEVSVPRVPSSPRAVDVRVDVGQITVASA